MGQSAVRAHLARARLAASGRLIVPMNLENIGLVKPLGEHTVATLTAEVVEWMVALIMDQFILHAALAHPNNIPDVLTVYFADDVLIFVVVRYMRV